MKKIVLWVFAITCISILALAENSNWEAIEKIFGRKSVQIGDIVKFSFPTFGVLANLKTWPMALKPLFFKQRPDFRFNNRERLAQVENSVVQAASFLILRLYR